MTILLLGGAGGIGSALARRLAARGQSAFLIGRTEAPLRALGDELGFAFACADVTDPVALARAVTTAAEANGGALTGLAYCVGSIRLKPLVRLQAEEMNADFMLNAAGAALAIQAALPAFKAADGASIVLFSSVAAQRGFASHVSVSMAKGAVEGLTRALAAELAPRIRVNCVAPSLTRTPLAADLTRSTTMSAAIAATHPLQRLGEADDIAAMADFLLSDRASWMTGQVIAVDGGRSIASGRG